MKTLVSATTSTQSKSDDFNWTDTGEILTLPTMVCDRAPGTAHSCGCERSFTGIGSAKATTFGIVKIMDETAAKNLAQKGKLVQSWSKLSSDFVDQLWGEIEFISETIDHLREGAEVRIGSTPQECRLILPVNP